MRGRVQALLSLGSQVFDNSFTAMQKQEGFMMCAPVFIVGRKVSDGFGVGKGLWKATCGGAALESERHPN